MSKTKYGISKYVSGKLQKVKAAKLSSKDAIDEAKKLANKKPGTCFLVVDEFGNIVADFLVGDPNKPSKYTQGTSIPASKRKKP